VVRDRAGGAAVQVDAEEHTVGVEAFLGPLPHAEDYPGPVFDGAAASAILARIYAREPHEMPSSGQRDSDGETTASRRSVCGTSTGERIAEHGDDGERGVCRARPGEVSGAGQVATGQPLDLKVGRDLERTADRVGTGFVLVGSVRPVELRDPPGLGSETRS
jgi:hypothetical protein